MAKEADEQPIVMSPSKKKWWLVPKLNIVGICVFLENEYMSDALLEAMREINATLLPSLRREAYNEYMRRYQSAADHLITNISSSQVTISCLPISYSPHLIELALNRSVIGTISFIQAVLEVRARWTVGG